MALGAACNVSAVTKVEPTQFVVAAITLRARPAGEMALSWWSDGAGQWGVRVVGAAEAGTAAPSSELMVEASGFDLWAALRAARLELETHDRLLCIQAACINVWPSHQARATRSGTKAFHYAAAGSPGEETLVDLFDPAPAELVGRVAEQEEVALERQRRFTLAHLSRDAHRP